MKSYFLKVFLILLFAIIPLVVISSLSALPFDQKKQAAVSPATEALARLKEAQFYSSQPPSGSAITGSQSYALEKTLPGVLRDLGLHWEPDPRLAALARWVNELYEVNFRPEAVAINEAAGWLGLPEPLPHFITIRVPPGPRLGLLIKESLLKIEHRDEYTHYGALAEVHSSGWLNIIFVFSSRHLFLSPFPRNLDEPGEVELKLGISPGLTEPFLIHTPPEGQPEAVPVEGESLSLHPARLKIRLHSPGKHKIEVVARNRRGPTVLANFPVFVGISAREFTGQAFDSVSMREQSAAAVQEKLYKLINEERARSGLNRLERDPQLETIARNHSLDMARNNFTGHVSPTTGEPDDRLRAAGIQFIHFGENVGQGYNSAEDLHRGFMDSPGHRMILLDPRYTHFGVGVETRGSGPGKAFLVTELFIKKPGQTPEGESGSELIKEMNKTREKAGLEPVKEMADLKALAQRAADEFSQKENFETDELQLHLINVVLSEKLSYKRLQILVMTATTEEEILEMISKKQVMAKRAGLGLKKISAGKRAGKILAILLYE